ncbi:MAG: electron transport complex protein RnfD [Candidatus Azotimanducaceae bacterium]|jgi:electron transport complex protein RnfD
MSFLSSISSDYKKTFENAGNSTNKIMLVVLIALVPGFLMSIFYFGIGIATNVAVCIVTCLALESLVLKIRTLPQTTLLDGSALVTACLLGLCLPPDLSLYMVILGSAFAMIFGKLLYGGLGHNIFNPAMVGYAALIISFPLAMSTWPNLPSPLMLEGVIVDGYTAATPLDIVKFRGGLTTEEIGFGDNIFLSTPPWQSINFAYLLGGLFLVFMGIARWQATLSMLLTLFVLYAVTYDGGSSQSFGSPLFHLFSGGTMFAAFFILTDPVTAPDSTLGLIIFGCGIGLIIFIIRSFGAYPDGIAFAVLLMNTLSPLIDHFRLAKGGQ